MTFQAADSNEQVVVIGAGIVGISIGLELQRRGFVVRILDRSGVAAEASAGNAGAFAFTDIIPLATPGILRKAPKWLLDPLGPLSIPPAYGPRIAPWLLRFWRASWPDRYAAAVAAQSALMGLCRAALERQIQHVDGARLIRRDGQLQLYDSARAFAASGPGWDLRRAHGIAFDMLHGADDIAALQPGLSPRFTHAVFTPNWMSTTDPLLWTQHLADMFRRAGGVIDRAEVNGIAPRRGGASLQSAAGSLPATKVVVAAGAWSHHLARDLGDRLPLETERGYNTTLPTRSIDLRMQLTFDGHGFVVTRLGDGLRVGGAVELGGLRRPPNFRRADTLLDKAAEFLPGLDTQGGTQWMGFRPSMPDSLPVIGHARATADVVYAFGHGHLGLTQAAGTAELVADMMMNRPPAIDLSPFAPTRF